MTVSTRVCCSMISETHTAYAEGCVWPRQGGARLFMLYQLKSLEEIRFILRRASISELFTRIHRIQLREGNPVGLHIILTLTSKNNHIRCMGKLGYLFGREDD